MSPFSSPTSTFDTRGPAFEKANALALRWEVPLFAKPVRADQYLTQKVKRISRSKIQMIIRQGDFRVGDLPIKPSTRLVGGEKVVLWTYLPEEKSISERPSPSFLYHHDGLAVLDKPSRLAVHPTPRDYFHTVTAWFKASFPKTNFTPCHRLDRETSGVLVCADNKGSERQLKECFKDGLMKKRYLAVVRGHLQSPHRIKWPLALQGDRGLVKIKMIHDPSGLPSRTFARPLFYDETTQRTLVLCRPVTGRQHQIRAHLSMEGFPIVGDKLYAMGEAFFHHHARDSEEENTLEHPRHALHAWQIAFVFKGKKIRFVAPFPTDLLSLLPTLENRAPRLWQKLHRSSVP